MKYRELYEVGKGTLMQANLEEAALDARLLLEFVCHTGRNDLLVHGDREVEIAQEEKYLALIHKRKEHIPLQHLTGVQEFMGLEFFVNENVLVPRQDTEVLVEEIMKNLHDGYRILDMCTGSGCILLSLLHYSNNCIGVGADLSEMALKVAQENAKRLQAENVSFIQSDLFENVEGKYEIIVSNPPYICTDVIETLTEEVRLHEPLMALDGGGDGLFFYRKIIEESPRYLCGGGQLFFEIGYDQKEAVTALMEKAGFKNVTAIKDYAGLDRVVYGCFY
ncbi:MAG: peptide chain release factor N(5)-glutamine methyltransferase [Lachnospiraceae bacterium]|nr:peptide chain release factor N(5)-glutamine methyltransferase [Lachnospiraceae bacterium]